MEKAIFLVVGCLALGLGAAGALMAVGFAMMESVTVGRVVLVCVWLAHVAYFCFGIKTIPAAAV